MAARRRIIEQYTKLLHPPEEARFLRLVPTGTTDSCDRHLFNLITTVREKRDSLIRYFKEWSIDAVLHYVPFHSSQACGKDGRKSGEMSVTKEVSERLVKLPRYYGMREEEVEMMEEVIRDFYPG